MTAYESASLWVNGIAVALLLATFVVYVGQLYAMRKAMNIQSLLAMVNHLQGADVREARRVVITSLQAKPLLYWDDADRSAASLVCATYDIAARMIQLGGMPANLVTATHGQSISRCYQALRPWIEEMRSNMGDQYLGAFTALGRKLEGE